MLRQLCPDQRGAIMLMTVLLLVFLMLLTGLATDVARHYVAREDLQTALDASSLAGAMNAVRQVTVSVLRGHTECDQFGCYCVSDGIEDVSGTEKRIIEQGGWSDGDCDSYLGLRHRWLEYPTDTQRLARQIFDLNRPRLLTPEGGGEITNTSFEVYGSEGNRYYPSVVARAAGQIQTTFLKLARVMDLPNNGCSQSSSFYQKVIEGIVYGFNHIPQDACK